MFLFVTYILGLFAVIYCDKVLHFSPEHIVLITLITTVVLIIVRLLTEINKKLDDIKNNKKEGE